MIESAMTIVQKIVTPLMSCSIACRFSRPTTTGPRLSTRIAGLKLARRMRGDEVC